MVVEVEVLIGIIDQSGLLFLSKRTIFHGFLFFLKVIILHRYIIKIIWI